VARRRTIRSRNWSVSSAGPFTATAASNLSVGSCVVASFSSQAHLTASARFRARAPGPVSGRLCGTAAWRGRPSRPGFPLRLRCRCSLFGHPMPAVGLGLPHGRLTGQRPRARPGPRRGYRVPHARAATGVGAPYTPRTAVLFPAEGRARPAPAARRRPVLITLLLHPTDRAPLHEASTRVHAIHPSGLPRPVAAPGGTGRPWASPRASHPAVTGDARRGWDRPSSTDLELHAHITLILQSGSSLVACDLASHRRTQASGATVRTRSQTGRKRECSNRREAAQSSPPLPAFASGLASERKRLTRRPCRRGRSSAPGRVKTIARSRAHDQASPVPT
jgi:hypothetical protein